MSTGVEKGVISTAVPVIGIMPLRFLQCTQSQLQRMKYLGGTPDRQALSPTHARRGSGGWWLDTRAGQRTRRGASHGRRGLTRPTHQHVDCTVYTLLSPVLAAGSALARSPSRTVLSEALLGTCFGTTSARIDGLMCRYVITTQGACGFARPPAGVRQCRSTRLGIGRPAVGGEAWCVCHC